MNSSTGANSYFCGKMTKQRKLNQKEKMSPVSSKADTHPKVLNFVQLQPIEWKLQRKRRVVLHLHGTSPSRSTAFENSGAEQRVKQTD